MEKQKSWFGRNWPWVIPLGGCLTIILLLIFGVGAAIFGVTNLLKHSTPYEYALETAKNNIEVVEILGTPIEVDGIMSGNLSFENDHGEANLEIPIVGPKGEARIIVIGEKYDGEWHYEILHVIIRATRTKINLLDKDLEGI